MFGLMLRIGWGTGDGVREVCCTCRACMIMSWPQGVQVSNRDATFVRITHGPVLRGNEQAERAEKIYHMAFPHSCSICWFSPSPISAQLATHPSSLVQRASPASCAILRIRLMCDVSTGLACLSRRQWWKQRTSSKWLGHLTSLVQRPWLDSFTKPHRCAIWSHSPRWTLSAEAFVWAFLTVKGAEFELIINVRSWLV